MFLYIFYIFLFLITYEIARIIFYTQRGIIAGKKAQLVQKRHPNPSKKILVIGDCGTVSVGVKDPKNSIVGRLANDFADADILNLSKNSMSIRQLEKKITSISNEKFDQIIINIGSIDAFIFMPQMIIRKRFENIQGHRIKMGYPSIILVSMTNLGSLPLVRFPFSYIYSWQTERMTSFYKEICEKHDMVHVPLYEKFEKDSLRHPVSLFTNDAVHPNDDGHGIWYEKIKNAIK